jgi:hypothetical protein
MRIMEQDFIEQRWDKKVLSKTGEHFYPSIISN